MITTTTASSTSVKPLRPLLRFVANMDNFSLQWVEAKTDTVTSTASRDGMPDKKLIT